jgi:hypothetical protein
MAEWNRALAAMRAERSSQLALKDRVLLSRLDLLSHEEIKRLTTREIFAYFKLDKADRAPLRRNWARPRHLP